MLLSVRQMTDFKWAAIDAARSSKSQGTSGQQGNDADWFRAALADRGIKPCISSKSKFDLTLVSTCTALKSRTCSESSRIGGASTPAMIDAHIPFFVRVLHRRNRNLLDVMNDTNGYSDRPICAHSRIPIDLMVSGISMRLFQASQIASMMA